MMTKLVCEGDRTSHGEIVKKATLTFTVDGRKIALIDDIESYTGNDGNPIIEHG